MKSVSAKKLKNYSEISSGSKPGSEGDVIRFHIRHALYTSLIFLLLLAICFKLFDQQYQINVIHENQSLLDSFKNHTAQLDNLLSRVTSRVQSMRLKAEFDLLESRSRIKPQQSNLFNLLEDEEDDQRYYHLDSILPPYTVKTLGNLTGYGTLVDRHANLYREINMALNLNPQFHASSQAVEDAAWVYYTSANGFINIYPWVSSKEFKYSDELLTHEFFTLGLPGNNRDRSLFWTEVYVDEYGKGLMTTCAVPVYDKDQFLGTVAIDLTVDFLNTKVKEFNNAQGIMFIANERKQLLAHPTLISSENKITKSIDQALSAFPDNGAKIFEELPPNEIVTVGAYTLITAKLKYAPWNVYYYTKRPTMWGSYFNRFGMGGFVLLAGLLILMVITFYTTHFHFILPSRKLVQYIMDHGGTSAPSSYGKVPVIWQPWFRKIAQTFGENTRLTVEIQQQNEELEKRVSERTAELLEANNQLRLESEERLLAEKEKQRLKSKLQHAQKMEAIGMLAGGVAHDLNNVLAGLVSYPQLLLMQIEPDSPLRESISTIKKGGEQAAAIVQDLLTLARRGVTVTEVVNINNIIQSYLESPECKDLKERFPNVHIKFKVDHNLLNLVGSPFHLSKCIMNLVNNSAEAMPDGGNIIVQTENRYIDKPVKGYDDVEEGDYVILQVADTGVGIAAADIERIFEPFFTKKEMGRSGTGLGMAVVWGALKDHHGYIDIESQPNRGTTFTLYFPATRKQLPSDKAEICLEQYQSPGEFLLIIDDVKEQRDVGTLMLQRLGYNVDAVASGEEALNYVRSKKPDLVILDMIMDPGMDGLETYQEIVKIHPGQKAIITSGYSETDRVRETQRLGAGTYVRKPYLIDKIAVAVRNELDKV